MVQLNATMESGDSKNNRESLRPMSEKLLNLPDSEDDDDLKDKLSERSETQIAPFKERDKVDVSGSKDFAIDFLYEPYVFSYEGYRIIGDTAQIEKVVQTCGMININVADITSTLSTDTVNYVTVGVGDNICDAMVQSVDNLPVTTGNIAKMLFQILIPDDHKPVMSDVEVITGIISNLDNDIDVIWGFAYDETLIDNIKVILITSSK